MKSKKIPADIKLKSIKEAQNEIKEIIANLENSDVNLEESMVMALAVVPPVRGHSLILK